MCVSLFGKLRTLRHTWIIYVLNSSVNPLGRHKILLKGTVSRDFWPFFFCLKDSTWAPYEQAKTVSRTFSFSRRYSRKTCVRVVNKYADTVSAYSTTTPTSCQRSQRLRGHLVSVVSDYEDTRFSRISTRKRKKFAKPFLPVTKWNRKVGHPSPLI